jgi:hypothetical protein
VDLEARCLWTIRMILMRGELLPISMEGHPDLPEKEDLADLPASQARAVMGGMPGEISTAPRPRVETGIPVDNYNRWKKEIGDPEDRPERLRGARELMWAPGYFLRLRREVVTVWQVTVNIQAADAPRVL